MPEASFVSVSWAGREEVLELRPLNQREKDAVIVLVQLGGAADLSNAQLPYLVAGRGQHLPHFRRRERNRVISAHRFTQEFAGIAAQTGGNIHGHDFRAGETYIDAPDQLAH